MLYNGSAQMNADLENQEKIREINEKSAAGSQAVNNDGILNHLQAMSQPHDAADSPDLQNGHALAAAEPLTQQEIEQPLQAAVAGIEDDESSGSAEVDLIDNKSA